MIEQTEILHSGVQPACFMMDFEKATMNSLTRQFPDVVKWCCLFQLPQIIYRKVVDLGLYTMFFSGAITHKQLLIL